MMDEQIEAMEQQGGRSDVRLEQEANEARARAEEAERRVSLMGQELDVLKGQLDRAKEEVREEKRKVDEATRASRQAEDDVKELSEQLAAERQKQSSRQREDATSQQRAQQRNQEVARYQKENKLLAEENERLNGKIESLMAECVNYSEMIVTMDDAAQAWRGREADVEAAAEDLRRERDKLAAQLETTRMDLDERTQLLQVFEEKFAEEHSKWESERQRLASEIRSLRTSGGLADARGAISAVSPAAPLVSPRRREAMKQAHATARNAPHPDDPRYVEELEAEVAELRDLRVLLLEAYDQLEKDVGREVDIALKRQARHHANLEAKVNVQEEALQQEQKRFKALDRALSEAQEELAESHKRMQSYEAGVYGLSEAMRDLKQLRLQVRAADQQVRDAVETSNDLGRRVEDLMEETRFLRQKAGIPEDADIDLGDFKLRSKVEAAQLRALNAQLEREVQELEEDRRRLRNELRYRAKWQGEHAARLGLSARQLAMLEEYADALRFGDDSRFQVDDEDSDGHPALPQRAAWGIGARAVTELEEANRQLQERLAEALERAQLGGVAMPTTLGSRPEAQRPGGAGDGVAAMAAAMALGARGAGGGASAARAEADAAAAAQIAELQQQLARARGEIVRLEDGYHDAMMRSSLNQAPSQAFPQHPDRPASPELPSPAAAAVSPAAAREDSEARVAAERRAEEARVAKAEADAATRRAEQEARDAQSQAQAEAAQRAIVAAQEAAAAAATAASNAAREAIEAAARDAAARSTPATPDPMLSPAPAFAQLAPTAAGGEGAVEGAVSAEAYAQAVQTVDRLRGERNALHARVRQLQGASGALREKEREVAHLRSEVQRLDAAAQAARFQPVGSPVAMGAASPEGPSAAASMGANAASSAEAAAAAAAASSAEAQRAREECAAADRALASLVEDLNAKEDQLEQLVSDVAKYKQAMTEMGSTRSALYREHVRAKAGWVAERAALQERARRAESEAEANRVEANNAQTLAERLKPGAESGLKEALAAAHSRLSVLQVREVRLAKALESAVAKEAQSRKEKEELELDAQEMSRAAQERLAFHERRAAEAELRAARCQRELDLCVPRAEHAALAESNRSLQTRFKELLETKTNSLVTASQLAAAREDAATARAEAEASTAASQAAQRRVRELVEALEGARRDAAASGVDGDAKATAVELRRETAEARADLDAAKRAAQLTQRETTRLEESKSDLERTVAGLEAQLADAKKSLHESREAERAHLAKLATCVSEQKHRAEMDALQYAEDEVARLRAEVIRAENRASQAETELSKKTAGDAARAAELSQLRSSVREMERRSDAAAALARANEEVVRLKGSEAQLRHHVQVAEAEADRLHADCLRLHRRLQVQDGRLFSLREDSRSLAKAQDAALSRMEAALAGRVDAADAEKWERALAELKKGAERREALLEKAHAAVRDAADRAESAEARLEELRSLERLVDGADADANLREIRRLGEELLQAKLAAARSARAASASSDRAAYLESIAADRETHLGKIEETVMREKHASDAKIETLQRELRVARREALEARASAAPEGGEKGDDDGRMAAVTPVPQPRRRANAEALAAVGAAAAVGVSPGASSAETQRMVLQQIEAIRALKLRAAEAEAQSAQLEREVAHARLSAKNAEEERDAYKRRFDAQAATNERGGGVAAAGDESAVAQVTAVAQSTIARLQELVAEKNQALTRAQAAMSDLRADALEKQAEDRKTIEELNDLLFKQNQREIASMRDAAEYGGKGGEGGEGEGDELGAGRFAGKSHDQLVALLKEREHAIEVLTMKYEQQRARHEVTEARLAEEAEQRAGEMRRVMADADRDKARGPSRVLETLVSRLKTQLAQKDKRLAQLKEAIKELERKLVEAMQKAADVAMRGADKTSEETAARASRGAEASVLAAKLKRAQDELAKMKDREARWDEERERLVADARSATEAASRASAAARRASSVAGSQSQSQSRAPSSAGDAAAAARDPTPTRAEREETARRDDRAEELENRVKVLTAQNAKLNRLLRAEQSESALKRAAATGGASPRGAGADASENRPPEPSEDDGVARRREETLARWEEGVKLRKRAEQLAKKLAARTREHEDVAKLAERRQAHIVELTKEKNALAAKAKALGEEARRAGGVPAGSVDAAAAKALHDECEAARREATALRRVVDVEQAAEIARLKRQLRDAEERGKGGAEKGDAGGAAATAELEARIRALEGELLARDDAALGLKFEAEQAAARADRMQRRVDELFRGGVIATPSPMPPGKAAKRAQELEDVVEALKKVVEKQQSELAATRGRAAAASRGAEHARAAKEARLKIREMQEEMVSLRRVKEEHRELLQRSQKLERENAQLRRGGGGEGGGVGGGASGRARESDAEALLAAAQAEAADTALALAETRDALIAQRKQLDAAREDAARAIAAAAAGGGGAEAATEAELRRLAAENADLRAELDALDPAFFDEVMDMKRAYHEQAGVLERYEELLRRYAAQLGVPFTPISPGSASPPEA